MQQVLNALLVLVLGLASLLQATRNSQKASVRLGQIGRRRNQVMRLHLDPSVHAHITGTTPSAIANMSLSPWTYRESSVESRLPRTISHAHCLTSGCLSLWGGEEDAALEARPIYYQVLVLKRVLRPNSRSRNSRRARKVRHRYVFQLGTEVIPVGCTCVRPGVVPQQ